MIVITPEDQTDDLVDLFQSLQSSVLDLRHEAEDLKKALQAGQELDQRATKLGCTDLQKLIRDCQKVETCLVERKTRQTGIVQNGYALDLDAAKAEIGCRLDRLRKCCDTGEIP
jgi:hypothetical protein